jgi:nucleoside-diphosphate-sugar epimerase
MTHSKKLQKILVTGGLGFIGSHIVDRLLCEGYEVTVLDNLSTGKIENIIHNRHHKGLEIVKGDIRDSNLVKKAMKGADVVFHEAALASVALSVKNPLLTNDVNVSGTLNILKTAADLHVKRLIFASSAAVYGETRSFKKKEDDVPNPTSPYGVSKLAGEKYARSFSELYGLETVSLRYFNVYGPRQNYNLQAQYGGVITIFLNQLFRNMSPTIYGDGEQTRDFVYVKDIVQANLLAMESKNAIGESFNIASGIRTSVNRIAETLKDALGKKNTKNLYLDPRLGDLKHGYANISKAKKMLNYVPSVSFEEGIADLVDWYTKNRQSSS